MNEPLLFAALVDLTMHPEQHDQDIYLRRTECGTTMCLAGDVAVLAGHSFIWDGLGEAWYVMDGRSISAIAQHELDISRDWADRLFLHCSAIEDLWADAELMTHGRVRRPEGL